MDPGRVVTAQDRPTRPVVGERVLIIAGDRAGAYGTVTWSGVDGSCGCWSVVVRHDHGEWWGKSSEVRRAGGPITPDALVLVGESGPERLR
jgi:hypothetical protein